MNCYLLFLSLIGNEGAPPAATESMSGDPNPPPYSVINVDVDTYVGPVAIDSSVIGYLNDAESTSIKRFSHFLTDECHEIEDKLGTFSDYADLFL